MTLSESTVCINYADAYFDAQGYGGGIYNAGALTINNCTISGNVASQFGFGGGIYNAGEVRIYHSTVTQNGSYLGEAGGIFGPVLEMRDTIVAGNHASPAPDFSGTITTSGYNLIGDTSGGSGFVNTDLLNVRAMLGPFQNNGGPTFTHALLPGSPAIAAGDPTGAPPYDQRGPGFARTLNGTIDIGAFEVQGQGGLTGASSISPLVIDALGAQRAAAEPAGLLPSALSSTELAGRVWMRRPDLDGMAPASSPTAGEATDYFCVGESAGAMPEWWDWIS
jgi:hypothetical protein